MTNGRISYTPEEEQERQNFILTRIRAGFSRIDIQRQYASEYNCHIRTARAWYNQTCDYLTECQDASLQEKRRIRSSVVEMYHAQIASAQSDLANLQQELSRISGILDRRQELHQYLLDVHEQLVQPSRTKLRRIEFELEVLPEVPVNTKSNLLEIKSRMRERLFRMLTELAKIQGVYQPEMPWMEAVNVLLDHDLLPAPVASQILSFAESFTLQEASTEIPPTEADG